MSFNKLNISQDLIDLVKQVTEKKLDPVDKSQATKSFNQRKDKDIDNDGNVDSTDKYLHKRRNAISTNVSKKRDKVIVDPTIKYVNESNIESKEMKSLIARAYADSNKNRQTFKKLLKQRGSLTSSGVDNIMQSKLVQSYIFESLKHEMIINALNELSTKKLGQYKDAAVANAREADKVGDTTKANKRLIGVIKATKKQFANEIKEQVDITKLEDQVIILRKLLAKKPVNAPDYAKFVTRFKGVDNSTLKKEIKEREELIRRHRSTNKKQVNEATKKQFANEIKEQVDITKLEDQVIILRKLLAKKPVNAPDYAKFVTRFKGVDNSTLEKEIKEREELIRRHRSTNKKQVNEATGNSYPVTLLKHKDNVPHIRHVSIDHDELKSGSVTPERVRNIVNSHPKIKDLKSKGYSIHKYGEHDNRKSYYGQNVKIEKE
jgi:hypothetical protein